MAAPVHSAFIGVLFSCWAVALLFENHLLACLWQLYSHLPNDLGVLTTLFGLSSSNQHLGLAVIPSLLFFMSYTGLLYLHFISLSQSFFPHRHSALWQTAWWVKLPQWRFQSTVTVTLGHYQRTTALNRWVLSTVSVDGLFCATFTQGKAITWKQTWGYLPTCDLKLTEDNSHTQNCSKHKSAQSCLFSHSTTCPSFRLFLFTI